MNLNSAMFSIAGIKNQLDEVRAMVYPKNDTEKRVYEALSSQNNYGASSTEMQEIAQETFEFSKFNEIMKILWTTIEDTEGRSWKQIFKALMLLDFLIKNGSERVIDVSRDKQYRLRSLQDFSFYEGPNDKGQGIRDKSKMIIELLADNDAIRSEREKAKTLRSKFVGVGNDRSGGFGGGYDSRDRDFGSSSSSSSSSSNFSNSGSSRDRGFGGSSGSSSGSGGYRDNQSSSSSFGSSSYKDNRESPKESFQNDASSSSFSSSGSNGRYSGDSFKNSSAAPEVALNFSKSNASTASSASSSNKIKISIKSNDNAASKGGSKLGGTVAAAPEIDLFGSDFTSQPAPPPVPTAAPAFDAFGSSSNGGDIFSSPPQGQQQVDLFAAAPVFNNNNNNNFNSNAPFDPFGGSTVFQSSSAPVQAPVVAHNNNQFNNGVSNGFNNNSNNNFNNFGNNNNNNNNNNNFSNNNNFGNSNNFNSNNAFAPQQQFASNPLASAASVNNFAQKPASSDFGDFEVAKPNNNNINTNNNSAIAAAKPPANNFGGLVDLGSLKVEAPKASNTGGNPTAATMHLNNASHNSFAGLDGFSKTQQSMGVSSTGMRPVNGNNMGGMPIMGGGMPMGGMQQGGYGNMMQQQPMQGMPMMGGNMQQGGYGNMQQQQQPMQGMPMMGGNMMMNPQQQQMGMMGGGMQQQGGFVNMNTNMGGGMQMGQQQQQQPYRQNPNQGRGF